MGASTRTFIAGLTILILFNFFYVSYYPLTETNVMFLGALVGLVVEAFAIGTLAGIQFFGTGLNSASIKIIFGIATLINCLFQIQVANVPLGLGLANNVYAVFDVKEFYGFGWLIASSIVMITLISGLMVVVGGSD